MEGPRSFPGIQEKDLGELHLAERQIHVWSLWLDPDPARVEELERVLSEDELERAYRFRFEVHRRRFIVGRGVLRRMLSHYTGLEARQLRFDYGPKGKPSLVKEQGGDRLTFNLSHSEDLALFGITPQRGRGRELGVDVEQLRPMPDAEAIAERFFSASEREALRAIPVESKSEAFFHCWTRKEAYIKATGDGLSMPLDRFDVTLTPGEPARMLRMDGDREGAKRWSMLHLEPTPGYIGALAIEGHGWQLECREWVVGQM